MTLFTFYRPPVTRAQSITGTEKPTDSDIFLIYNDDDCSQGYGKFKEDFKALTKDNILKPYISDHDFRSSTNRTDVGFNLYVLDIRHQKIQNLLNELQ